ncbi:AAA family ATPase [Endozoicomonas gorgoniicola]|uniref:AAA family ATPase n=1 Tax=Endozoicomonas gorgoniicola TaxID=1234144 RepID=A0ABT3N2S7_9GAMM|nr:AAA family ATPase [Endozoicomonas gorgoniicola]MCW7555921.1 AAA family ATPase [Endozoicomonas gorgoniicola]
MSIQVDLLRVSGFRGIQNLEMTLPRVAVLIGTNNSGKTSVIKALQLALGDYSRYLSDEDFHIDADEKVASKVLVDIRIIAVDSGGNRTEKFEDEWVQEFGDKIQQEADGKQFFALRTESQSDPIKGGYNTNRYALSRWPAFDEWQQERTNKKNSIPGRLDALPFIGIEAQRDIHQELKEKSSLIGRVLASVDYDSEQVSQLESMVQEINELAVKNSESLTNLKQHLGKLNQSFQGSGRAEITPFPKKMRDLSKQFTVHFGEQESSSFSMEYHGMGTRSWASMLTVKAFTEMLSQKYEEEAEPFFPVVAAEEPEAHLHPNAQRTLYRQLVNSVGQIIVSTHSPYLAALANQNELRYLVSANGNVSVSQLDETLSPEDKRKLQREVVHSRGELIFSKALVLSEGETEEQALPQMFERYFGHESFELGINFIGVGGSGAKYRPFLNFAHSFGIPVFIFSDGEEKTVKELSKQYQKVFGEVDIHNNGNITILDKTDFEGYLLEAGFATQIETAIIEIDGQGYIESQIEKKQGTPLKPKRTNLPNCKACKQPIFESPLRDYSGDDGRNKAILEIVDAKKPMYAQAITEELCKLEASQLPEKVIDIFEKIKAGLHL